jgi:hypothetical protein
VLLDSQCVIPFDSRAAALSRHDRQLGATAVQFYPLAYTELLAYHCFCP